MIILCFFKKSKSHATKMQYKANGKEEIVNKSVGVRQNKGDERKVIMMKKLTSDKIRNFQKHLMNEEKSSATVKKYTQDARDLMLYLDGQELTKERALAYKQALIQKGYLPRSVNSKIASMNSLFSFLKWEDCKVKILKIQREIYQAEEKELTKAEYMRLLDASRKKPRLCLLIETICGTGIRVSELQFFTVESVRRGSVVVSCKNKTRTILIPRKLRGHLLDYAKKKGIATGVIFCTRKGKPMNRSNIWADMKGLCEAAGVNPKKVFPHNLRKLFARTFYGIEKDIAKLADILGHSSIETTRIYIMSSGREHRRKIEQLGLVL